MVISGGGRGEEVLGEFLPIALCIYCHVLVKYKEKIEQPKKRSVDDTRQDTTTGWISHSRKLQVISYEFPVLPVSRIWIC